MTPDCICWFDGPDFFWSLGYCTNFEFVESALKEDPVVFIDATLDLFKVPIPGTGFTILDVLDTFPRRFCFCTMLRFDLPET